MNEFWKPVKGFEGLYEVSNTSKVKRIKRIAIGGGYLGKSNKVIEEKIMKPYLCPNGYYGIILVKNGEKIHKSLHRLIAEAFIPNPYNLPTVDHIDRNRINNSIENLRWVDMDEQNNNRDLSNMIDKSSTPIMQLTLDGEYIRTFKSIASVKEMGFTPSLVCRCCKGERKKHKGYIWKYVS